MGGFLGEEVPIPRDILVIFAALFRLVAGIVCGVVVFIVKGGAGWLGGGPYGKTLSVNESSARGLYLLLG